MWRLLRLMVSALLVLLLVYGALAFVDGLIGFGGVLDLYEWSDESLYVYKIAVDLTATLFGLGVFLLFELALLAMAILARPTGKFRLDQAWVMKLISGIFVLATVAFVAAIIGAFLQGLGIIPAEIIGQVLATVPAPLDSMTGLKVYATVVGWGANLTPASVVFTALAVMVSGTVGGFLAWGVYPSRQTASS